MKDSDDTIEIDPVEVEQTCSFELRSVSVDGTARVTTVCTACGCDVEAKTGMHSSSRIVSNVEACPNCGARNVDFR